MTYGDPNAPALPPPGWYTDPANPALERWWAGPSWTDHVRELPPPIPQYEQWNGPAQTAQPYQAAQPYQQPQPYQPMGGWSTGAPGYAQQAGFSLERTSPNTVPIWLLATTPVFNAVAGAVIQVVIPQNDLLSSLAINIVWFGALLALVLWDRSVLVQRGLPAASWAWLFLTVIGYLIARRIVLKGVGVRHNAPGNVFAGIVLLAIALAVVAALIVAGR